MQAITREPARVGGRTHVGTLLARQAEVAPDKDFLRLADRSYTYAEAETEVRRLATGLAARGVRQGDAVCLMLPNCAEYVFTWLALARIGAVTVSINTGYKDVSLERSIIASGAALIVLDSAYVDDVLDHVASIPHLTSLVVVGDDHPAERSTSIKVEPFASLPARPGPDLTAEVRPADPLMMVFTSGTSGLPKPVEISHAYGYLIAEDSAYIVGMASDDVLYCAYPLYHSEAPLNVVLPGLLVGATVALGARFSASGFWDEVNRFGATFFTFLGGVINILLAQPPSADDANNQVRRVFGCPVPENAAQFEERFGLRLFEWYAATEGGMLAFDPLDEVHVPGSCGVPSPHYELRIVDEDDFDVPAGTQGEIVSRSRRPHGQMTGYFGQPDATLAAFADLWFHTRDLGHLDQDGRLHYHGRVGDAIRRRGVNISSLEVEQVLDSHPDVVESAVIGVPSELGTEHDVKAVVMTAADVLAEDLLEFARARLPRASVPRYLEVVRDMPRTPTGKVLKRTLRERWHTPGTYDAEASGLVGAPPPP